MGTRRAASKSCLNPSAAELAGPFCKTRCAPGWIEVLLSAGDIDLKSHHVLFLLLLAFENQCVKRGGRIPGELGAAKASRVLLCFGFIDYKKWLVLSTGFIGKVLAVGAECEIVRDDAVVVVSVFNAIEITALLFPL